MPQQIYARWGSAAIAALTLLALAVPSLSAQEERNPELDDPATLVALEAAHRQEQLREQKRKTPEETAARKRSRTDHKRKSRDEALALARKEFRDSIEQPVWRPLRLDRGERVKDYRGERAALIERENGTEGLAESFLPLRSTAGSDKKAPVSLELEESAGAYAPSNPLVSTRIPKELSENISFTRLGYGLRPEASAQPEAPTVVEDKVFYANTATDTDFLVSPTPTGVEASFVLRSADSPEELSLRFDLAPEDELKPTADGSGAVELIRGGEAAALIVPPAARDAEGERVPVSYAVSGSSLKVTARHREADFLYPILVDPVTDNYRINDQSQRINVTDAFAGWSFYKNDGGNTSWSGGYQNTFYGVTNGSSYGNGLYVHSNPTGGYYVNGQYGEWLYTAPRQSHVYRADFGHVDHDPVGSCLIEGIWSPSRFAWDEGHWDQEAGYPSNYRSPWIVAYYPTRYGDTRDPCADQHANYKAHYPNNPTAGNMVAYGLAMSGTYTRSARALTHMYGANIYLGDRENPRVTAVATGLKPTAWIDSTSPSGAITATDPGLGVYAFNLWVPKNGGGNNVYSKYHGCTGDRTARCPETWSTTYSYATSSMPEGISTVSTAAYDALYKASPATSWQVKVDRTPPDITELSGGLKEFENKGLYNESYDLRVRAEDGVEGTTDDGRKRSGMKSIEVKVDGQPQGTTPTQTCASGSCAMVRDYTFRPDDFSDGEHTITVTATDQIAGQAGADASRHTTTKSWKVIVDRRGDIYNAKQYTVDPNAGGELLVEEWARHGTETARRVEPDEIATRGPVPCRDDQPDGPTCGEVRTRSRYSEVDPAESEVYTAYRGTSETDARLPRIAELLDPANYEGAIEPVSQGPLGDVLATWQNPPPNYGSEYELYEVRETDEETTPVEDAGDDQDVTEQVTTTVRLWVDTKTRMPVKEETRASSGEVSAIYYHYNRDRLELAQVSSDFFKAGRPTNLAHEKMVHFRGNSPIGEQIDEETGATFRPYYFGPTASLPSGQFCLADARVEHLREPEADPIYDEHVNLDDLSPEEVAEGPPDPFGPMTTVDAAYNRLAAGETCSPGEDWLLEPEYEVHTAAGGSSTAAAWRKAYRDLGTAIQLEPTDEDFLRAGVQPVFFESEPTTAYVIRLSDDHSGAFVEKGGAAVVVTGPFDKNTVSGVIAELEQR